MVGGLDNKKKKSVGLNSILLEIKKQNEFKRPLTRYRETEENLIVMKCKEKICEIFSIINMIRDDILISEYLKKFAMHTISGGRRTSNKKNK